MIPTPRIRTGIGGWTYAPWRGTFYPEGLKHADELAYAANQVTAIEINGTFYGRQKPESFRKWRDGTPDGFVFAVKASRFTTHRKDLTEAGELIHAFTSSGITELGPKLGPILWQFPPTRAFDPAQFAAFLALLPREQDGIPLRHVLETRHPTFNDAAYMDLLRTHGIAHAIVESGKHDLLADLTADFIYARLENNDETTEEGYDSPSLDAWARRVTAWSNGDPADDLPRAGPPPRPARRDAFIFFISGDKHRAPHSAMNFRKRLHQQP